MKMNNRFIYGILSIVLAAIIAFIAIPAVTSKTSSTCEIVRMKNAVTRGTLITAEDIELVEVGGFNLPDSVARKTEDIAGTYAAADLYPGDYLLPEKVSSVPLSSDLVLNEIPDGKVAISITTQTLATGLSDKLQDVVRIFCLTSAHCSCFHNNIWNHCHYIYICHIHCSICALCFHADFLSRKIKGKIAAGCF